MKILIALIGWTTWTVVMLSVNKSDYDKNHSPFPIGQYAREHWDDWLGSILMIPVLLVISRYGWGDDVLSVIDVGKLKWTDAYTLGSGFAYEALVRVGEKLKL